MMFEEMTFEARALAEIYYTELAARDRKVLVSNGESIKSQTDPNKKLKPHKDATRLALRCKSSNKLFVQIDRLD